MVREGAVRTAALACAGALLAGCGVGASSAAPKAAATKTAALQSNATGNLTIKYPAGFAVVHKGLSTKRHAAYVNPTSGNVIHVYVDSSEIPGSPFAVAATPDGTQSLQVPFFSTNSNVVAVEEFDANANLLADGNSGSNPISPGSSGAVTLTMQMNATRIGLTTDPGAGSDALLLSQTSLPTPFCMSGSGVAYTFPVDPSNGFVLPGTAAGLGGIPAPVLASQTTIGTSKLLPQQFGLYAGFDGSEDPITASFQVTNPISTITYSASALLYQSANCAQPAVVNVNVGNFSPPYPYLSDPLAPANTSSFPIVAYQGYTYFAFSDYNNDVEFFIAKYDSQYNLVSVTGFPGDRYIGFITVNTMAQTVTFNGQYEEAMLGPGVTIAWSALSAL